MLTGIGKFTAQIATDGKCLLHIEQEGVGSGKAVALALQCCRNWGHLEWHRPGLPALPAGMCHTRSTVPSQGYCTHLPGWQGSFSQGQLCVGAASLAVATDPQPRCCQPSRGTDSERLEEQGAVQELSLSQEEHIPNAAKECPMTWLQLRGREGVWDHALEIPSLPWAHAFAPQVLWEPGETEGSRARPQVCPSCLPGCAWSTFTKLITCHSCLSRWSAWFMELSHCLTIFPHSERVIKGRKGFLQGMAQCAELLEP